MGIIGIVRPLAHQVCEDRSVKPSHHAQQHYDLPKGHSRLRHWRWFDGQMRGLDSVAQNASCKRNIRKDSRTAGVAQSVIA